MKICVSFVLLTNPKLKENAIQYTLLKFLFAKYPLVEEKKKESRHQNSQERGPNRLYLDTLVVA